MVDWVTAKQARSEFRRAVKESWFYVSVGLSLSGLFFILSSVAKYSHWYNFWVAGFEHLGMGFLVSALAVFFYEWGAHVKKTVDLSQELSRIINEDLNPVYGLVGLDAINRGCEMVSRKANIDTECLDNCRKLLMAVARLYEENGWVAQQCVGFISGLLKKVVSENVDRFSALAFSPFGEQPFKLPKTAADMADAILAAQMKGMSSGDRYQVISDLYSWKDDQLPLFWAATEEAVKDGVIVRRVFNLMLDPEHPQSKMMGKIVKKVLQTHLDAMNNWKGNGYKGSYEVKVFSEETLRTVKKSDQVKEDLRNAHGGIFRRKNSHGAEDCVRFKVIKTDLSEMELCRDQNFMEEELKLFDAVFGVPILNAEEIDKIADQIEKKVRGN